MRYLPLLFLFVILPAAHASEFKHVGDFLLQAHFKLTGQQATPIPMKPISFKVSTDGVHIRVSAEGDEESYTTYDIYRSDGIGRQRKSGGALEVIPGVQATSNIDGTMRHLRLTRESLTITTFPGVSDQTIVSYSVATEPKNTTTQAEEKPVPKP